MTDYDIIHYELSKFQEIYSSKSNQPIPDHLVEKVNYYKTNFSCFNSFYDPKMVWEKKKFNKKERQPKNRYHIIIHDFTDESMVKRQLIGYLNKLTVKNHEIIYTKLRDIISLHNNEEFFLVVWSYIKTTDNELYLKIIDFFNHEMRDLEISKLWQSYIANKEWMPPKQILENDVLKSNNEYDMFCDYSKWKKEINNMNKAWIILKKDVDILLDNIFEFFCEYLSQSNIYKHILDILLEQIDKILRHHTNIDIINKVKQLDTSKFDNSTKFLIYNIIEKNK
jgi:hypothetical protein